MNERNDQGTFFEALVTTLLEARMETTHDQMPPVVLLWPDKDRQWERLLPRLRAKLPLFTYGAYDQEKRTGPAYWLLCVIAGTLPQQVLPPGQIPIVYMPGLGTQEFQDIAGLPKLVQPLADLQFRGALWRQKKSGRDWTLHAFLTYSLGVDIHAGRETKMALHRALLWLVDEPVVRLRNAAPLGAAFFEALLASSEKPLE